MALPYLIINDTWELDNHRIAKLLSSILYFYIIKLCTTYIIPCDRLVHRESYPEIVSFPWYLFHCPVCLMYTVRDAFCLRTVARGAVSLIIPTIPKNLYLFVVRRCQRSVRINHLLQYMSWSEASDRLVFQGKLPGNLAYHMELFHVIRCLTGKITR